jgi:predicted transcriptional regulator
MINYPVQSTQIEVDGGYEGRHGLSLIEVKIGLKDNMNLRQLLYPQINYSILLTKPVRTYLFFYETGGFFHFIPFFYDGKNSSFDYANHKLFKLESPKRVEPKELLKTKVNNDLTGFNAPFPQADRFNKVMEILLKLGELECATKDELFFDFDLVTRQWDYYLNALIWLGLATKDTANECFVLSEKGASLFSSAEDERVFEIAKIAFSNDIFNAFLSTDKPVINNRLRKSNSLTSESTFLRRIQTVKSWKKYIFSLFGLRNA